MASQSRKRGRRTAVVSSSDKRMSDELIHTAPTLFLLMAQYNGQTVVPLDRVCRDFFGHLTVEKLLRKALRGDIALPIVRIETSQKAQRGVHLTDLAAYIDKRRAAAIEECNHFTGNTRRTRRVQLRYDAGAGGRLKIASNGSPLPGRYHHQPRPNGRMTFSKKSGRAPIARVRLHLSNVATHGWTETSRD